MGQGRAGHHRPRKYLLSCTFYGRGISVRRTECLQAVLVPFVGILGNLYNRVFMISAGTILWGAMASGMGFANNYAEVPLLHSHRACLSRMSRPF